MIGRVFWTGPVYELVEGAQPDFGLLEERDFVRRRQGSSLAGEREYVIKHALTREVAYASLPKAVRGHRHAAFADWLERQGEGRDEHAPLLAYHYAEAVRPDDLDLAWQGRDEEVERLRGKAIAWSRRAADLAIGRYEIDEGLSLLHRALELESDPRQQAELWHSIGHANALKFDGPRVPGGDGEGDRARRPPGRALHRARAAGGAALRHVDSATRSRARRRVGRARARALPGRLSHAIRRRWPHWRCGTSDEDAARALQAVAERLGDPELRSHALAALTDGGVAIGGSRSSSRHWSRTVSSCSPTSPPRTIAISR